MNPQGVMMNEGGRLYNFAEIWPGFQINANETRSYNLLGINPGSDPNPMVMNQISDCNRNPKSRKQRDEDTEGASTSNSNGNSNAATNGSDNKKLKVAGSMEILKMRRKGQGIHTRRQSSLQNRQSYQSKTTSMCEQEGVRLPIVTVWLNEYASERMKILQDLVPGCNKVIGKALVLDEIINYVQSLQYQVQLLSMKLEAVKERVSPGVDRFP